MDGSGHARGGFAIWVGVTLTVVFAGLLALEVAGVPHNVVQGGLAIAMLVLVLVVSLRAGSMQLSAFLAADRQMSSTRAGLALTMDLVSGPVILVVALTLASSDPRLGLLAPALLFGCALAAMLTAGPMRISGGVTASDMLAQRYDSVLLRLLASLAALLASGLLLTAQFVVIGIYIAGGFGIHPVIAVIAAMLLIFAITLPGGLRGIGRLQIACLWVVVAGIGAPLIAVWIGGNTAPPISPVSPAASPLALGLPQHFPGAPSDLVATSLCIATGLAVLPQVLMRMASTTRVATARWSFLWAMVATAAVLAAVALLPITPQATDADIDILLQSLIVFLDLTEAVSLPPLFASLLLLAVMSVAIATATAATLAGATAVSHDIYGRLIATRQGRQNRLIVTRLCIIALAAVAARLALVQPVDVFTLTAWAFSVAAGALFPAVVLGIWWRRAVTEGIVSGVLLGLVVTVSYIVATAFGADFLYQSGDEIGIWLGISHWGAGVFGLAAGTLAIVAVSLMRPPPDQETRSRADHLVVPRAAPLSDL